MSHLSYNSVAAKAKVLNLTSTLLNQLHMLVHLAYMYLICFLVEH